MVQHELISLENFCSPMFFSFLRIGLCIHTKDHFLFTGMKNSTNLFHIAGMLHSSGIQNKRRKYYKLLIDIVVSIHN